MQARRSQHPNSTLMFTRFVVLNVVGLTSRFFGPRLPNITAYRDRVRWTRIRPMLPAVTSSVQATYLTGKLPAQHGIVANGWYDRERAEHLFWKQSDRLVAGPKLWESVREKRPDFTCARLFWWNNMYSSVDFSITPRPIYCADGKKVFDVTSRPLGIRDAIKADLGEFPFPQFWGPGSGIGSSRWIADSAKWIEKRHEPDLNLVYLPHLDYNLQKWGPDDSRIDADLTAIDEVVGDLIAFFEKRGVRPILLSEYGITPVDQPIHLNRVFRERGWLEVKDELGREILEQGDCRALAIADHQIAHVYLNDPSIRNEVRAALEETDGVERVLGRDEQAEFGLNHPRSGDFVAIADERSWFTYYFWQDDAKAPDYARTVDIHRKPGYDPVELFVDPAIAAPKLKIAGKLLRKKLGQRILMDVIPLDANLVRGSHGRIAENREDWPVLIGPMAELAEEREISAPAVHERLLAALRQHSDVSA